ncbi:RagB/SusD family nutrient uptake outer membrane protein [Seonamhaeicola sp.]|uniref:RagB/SusD family nutrient uptake outer membrane protein n=1 Tax=Seonamhaeicola sp. TaxID=1912245 RepID=UPI002602DB95|nr:RagB/SusD family nutrient uptake outer membrane protein [Seonamhaeicola sp.]
MRNRKFIKFVFTIAAVLITSAGCNSELDLVPPAQFAAGNVLQTIEGMEGVLGNAYREDNLNFRKNLINMSEVSTDMGWNTGGGENRTLQLFMEYTWDPSTGWINGSLWLPRYRAIRNCNVVLDNIESANIEAGPKALLAAEARYLRAASYYWLYNYFGTVPLRTTGDLSVQEANLPRASEEEMLTFIETELNAVVSDLPNPGQESQYGRATKGHALGILTKFLLNTKQWAKVVTATQQLMALNYYELFPDFRAQFFIENEGNKESVIGLPRINVGGNNSVYQNGAFPPGFRRADNIPEFEWVPGMANWATQYRLQDAFVDSYDPNDARLQAIIQNYYNASGAFVDLRSQANNSRCLKFFDNAQVANNAGVDMSPIRYADILLSRAEALNELNGPTQEALDLINMVRNRANLGDLTTAEATSKEVLRDLILRERGWEFVAEGKRWEDLKRHGTLISNAVARGRNAQSHHVLWPIPEGEVNANPNLEQNPGY